MEYRLSSYPDFYHILTQDSITLCSFLNLQPDDSWRISFAVMIFFSRICTSCMSDR